VGFDLVRGSVYVSEAEAEIGGDCIATDSPTPPPTDPPTDADTPSPTDETTTDRAAGCPISWSDCDYTQESCYKGPNFDDGTVNSQDKDQYSCWGPISEHAVTINSAGKGKLSHTYIYGMQGESCHDACLRRGDAIGADWYCDDLGWFNGDDDVDNNAILNGDTDANGRCSTPTGDDGPIRGQARLKGAAGAWSPYMRKDGRCYYHNARGKPKCFTWNAQVYRLCPCADFQQLLGRDHDVVDLTIGSTDISVDGSKPPSATGWYREGGQSCRAFCESGGLSCNEDVHRKFRGADMMKDLENALGGGICNQYVDTSDKAQSPSFRNSGSMCYVNTPGSNGSKFNCNTISRTKDNYRFCYCS